MAVEPRRRFLTVAGLAGAGVIAGSAGSRAAAQGTPPAPVSTVQTPVLSIGYEDSGDPRGVPVILLHGFPDDVRAFDEVVPPLAKAGYRVLVPYLRGYGPTRFRDPAAPRMAQQAAIGQDVIDFADALRLPRFALAGYDWGGRAAAIAAALHPDRVRATVLIGGYTVQNTVSPQPPAAPATEHRLWYQDHFNTDRGRAGLEANRRAICRYLWQAWSPNWRFSDDTYNRTAPVVRQSGFRGRGHPLVPASHRQRGRRGALHDGRSPAGHAAANPGTLDHALWRGRRDRHPFVRVAPGRACGVREAGRASSRPRRRPLHAARASRGGVLGAARTPGGRRRTDRATTPRVRGRTAVPSRWAARPAG